MPSSRTALRRVLLLCLALCLLGIAGAVWLWCSIPLDAAQITNVSGSPALYDAEGELFHLRLSPDSEWRHGPVCPAGHGR